MKKIKFDKVREAIENEIAESLRVYRRTRLHTNREILKKIEASNQDVEDIQINFQMRWGEDGTEWKATASYYCAGDEFPAEIETRWFGDAGGYDKETAAICHVLNEIMPIRYRLCYAEEMLLRGEWFGDRATFFPAGVGDRPIPGFVVTDGIKGLKKAMEVLGYEASGTIPLVFKRSRKMSRKTMGGV